MPTADAYENGVGLYVHWPFCEKKCPYCDFNSHVRKSVDHRAWRAALITELRYFAARFPDLTLSSIFFGGGTPSLMEPDTAHSLIEEALGLWTHDPNIEITLEANPSSVEAGRFRGYRAAGVNRLSIGIQSFDDSELKFLGRLHSAEAAKQALTVARAHFDRVSFDLIYALPDHNAENWSKSLKEALAFDPSHLSLYQLTIEEGTAFYQQFHRGRFSLPHEDEAARLFEVTQALCEEAGLPAYEISNHAQPGAESAHNLIYWRGQPYIGIGPGAHGRLPAANGAAIAHDQHRTPEKWLNAVNKEGHGTHKEDPISITDRMEEKVMMGLRLREGFKVDRDLLPPVINSKALQQLADMGLLKRTEQSIRLTAKGKPLLNAILERLLS